MSANVFQASGSAHQPTRLVITDEPSLDAVHPDSAALIAPVEDLVEGRQ